MRESKDKKRTRSKIIHEILQEIYPNVGTFLTHRNPFELLIAVILSAQCTDERVNMVTPGLFDQFPTPQALADAHINDIRDAIKSINFFNNKAKNIQKTAEILQNNYNSEVPNALDKLVELPGVGRKTANVVLGQAFGIPGITVDTHVRRLTTRLGLTTNTDPVKIEHDLMRIWDDIWWNDLSSTLILHGRNTCPARKPKCEDCALLAYCPQKL
ncbi:MAG: endonuclease III [bacterium]|nr:endonuclease III [bacterium]